jgi:hypothetical protein
VAGCKLDAKYVAKPPIIVFLTIAEDGGGDAPQNMVALPSCGPENEWYNLAFC